MTLGRSDPCHPVEGSGRTEDLEARSGVGMFSEDRTDLPERPPLNSLRIWEDVGTGIDRNQTGELESSTLLHVAEKTTRPPLWKIHVIRRYLQLFVRTAMICSLG